MRMNRMRKGLVVFNKLNGRSYKVVETSENAGVAVPMEAIKADGTIVKDEAVEINESNCLCFRAIADTEPYPVPEGYSAAEGILLKDGNPACEQGELVVEEVLAKIPGRLIIAAKNSGNDNGAENLVDVFAYEPHRDRFIPITKNTPMPKLVGYGEKGRTAVLMFCNMTEQKKKDEDGGETAVTLFDGAWIVTVTDEERTKISDRIAITTPVTVDEAFLVDDAAGCPTIFVPSDEVAADGFSCESPYETKKRTERIWMMIRTYDRTVAKINLDGNIQAVCSPVYGFVVSNDKAVYVNKNQLHQLVIKSAAAADVAKKYPVLVDVTKDGDAYRLTFADEGYNLKTVVSTKTRDRGLIVTVE